MLSREEKSRSRQFEQLALIHVQALYGVARQMVGSQGAEDLVQETYLRAWKYFDSFDPATNCRAWLFRILRNVWADRWRQPRLEIPLTEEESLVEPYYDWEGEFLEQHLSAKVRQALGELPEEYRWAVLLADVEELSYQEIATAIGCPIGTVMSRLNRGRRMLGRLLRTSEKTRPGSRLPAGADVKEK